MTKTSGNNYVPKDYEDLYRYYVLGDGQGNSLTHQIIRRILPYSDPDERETLAHDVFLRLIDKDMLKVFDPKKANFGGVIFFVTRTVCVNHLARKGRNPITGLRGGSLVEETSHSDDEGFEPGVYSLDKLFVKEDVDWDKAIDAKDLVRELMHRTAELAVRPRHKRDQSLHPLLMLLMEQNDTKECGEQLGVTSSTVHNWISVLKEMSEEVRAFLQPRKRMEKPLPMMPTEEV